MIMNFTLKFWKECQIESGSIVPFGINDEFDTPLTEIDPDMQILSGK